MMIIGAYRRLIVGYKSLPKSHRDRLLTDWIQRIRYPTADPYKYALYKLIGRVELSSRKTVPKVLLTTEDWLWYQLSLIREAEEEDGGQSAHEFYTLADLANILIKFGEGHFDPGRNRPLLYFQVLLMSGNFERVSLPHNSFYIPSY
jgi:nuclear pore complex protein Nup93